MYTASYALAQTLQLLSYPIEFSVASALPRLWDGPDRERARSLVRVSSTAMLAIVAPAATVSAIVGPMFLRLLGRYEAASQAYFLVPVVGWGIGVAAYGHFFVHVSQVAGKGRSVMTSLALAAGSNLAMNAVLVPRFGARGAAVSTLACYAIYLALLLRISRSAAGELADWGRVARIVLAAGLALPTLALARGTFLADTVAAVLYLAAYAALALVLGAVRISELRSLREMLRRPAKKAD